MIKLGVYKDRYFSSYSYFNFLGEYTKFNIKNYFKYFIHFVKNKILKNYRRVLYTFFIDYIS